jgi:hypothetical protein
MHGLQSVARIGQRALDNHAHRVVEVGLPHFRFDAGDPDVSDFHEIRLLMNDVSGVSLSAQLYAISPVFSGV